MEKQTVSEYVGGEITLFWLRNDTTTQFQLVLSITELIPCNQLSSPPLEGENGAFLEFSLGEGKTLQCGRIFCAVDDALESFHFHNWERFRIPFFKIASNYQRNPSQGYALIPSKSQVPLGIEAPSLCQILPNRSTSFRSCAFIDENRETEQCFTATEKAKAVMRMKELCDIDLETYPEFWGSNILCMTDPILWKIKFFPSKTGKDQMALLFPRDGQLLDEMRYQIQWESPLGITSTPMEKITSEVLPLPNLPFKQNPQLKIWSQKGELLESVPMGAWFSGSFLSTWHHRTLPNGKRVPVWPSEFYDRKTADDKNLIEQETERRTLENLEKKRWFVYFRKGEEERAQEIVGELLASAGREIVICDMYLDEVAIQKVIKGWVRCNHLVCFGSKRHFFDHKMGKDKEICFNGVKRELEEIKKTGNIKKMEVYSLPKVVHDRFIIIDDVAYCLGSSLNSFGKYDTALYKSPNSKAIIKRVQAWRNEAKLVYPGEEGVKE